MESNPITTIGQVQEMIWSVRDDVLDLRQQIGTILFHQTTGPMILKRLDIITDRLSRASGEVVHLHSETIRHANAMSFVSMAVGVAMTDKERAADLVPFVDAYQESVGKKGTGAA